MTFKNVDNQLQAKQNILKNVLLINLWLDLTAIAYTLERGYKYEVKSLKKKTQYAEIRMTAFLEAGKLWGTRSKG